MVFNNSDSNSGYPWTTWSTCMTDGRTIISAPSFRLSMTSFDSVKNIMEKSRRGIRISEKECIALMRSNALSAIGAAANALKEESHGDKVYYRNDLNINYTNICVNLCALCAFGLSKDAEKAYTMSIDDIGERIRDASKRGVSEFHVVGALNPKCDLGYVEDMFRAIRRSAPSSFIQGVTAVEADFFSRDEGISVEEVLKRLKRAGVGSIPGGGAEIFDPKVRRVICSSKISGERWLKVHRIAHSLDIPSNATMLFGHIETIEQRAAHMARLRALQDETGRFKAFVPLAFSPENTRLAAMYRDRTLGPTGWETLILASSARLFFDNIEHIKLVWQGVGRRLAQVSLGFGVDDIGGSSFEERIFDASGGRTFARVSAPWLPELILGAGRRPVERTSAYTMINRRKRLNK